MHEFQSFVYLAPQKTGTTFISAMLDRFCKEQKIRNESHQPMGADYDPKKFYFVSVRDPLDSYLSLYSYGSERRGKMHKKFRAEGTGDLYDGTMQGFNEWLNYTLKPKNAEGVDRVYSGMGGGAVSELVGLQSFRYLRTAIPDPGHTLGKCRSKDEIRAVYREKKLPTFFVRYETFTDDLCRLVRGPLAHAMTDVEAAAKFIKEALPINSSERVDIYQDEIKLRKAAARKLTEREWFLHEEFGY
jgi:hypothetical protein